MPDAQPSSRSIVSGSNVSACHISNWLIAVLGEKLHPTSHGCRVCQSFACSGVQRSRPDASEPSDSAIPTVRIANLRSCVLTVFFLL